MGRKQSTNLTWQYVTLVHSVILTSRHNNPATHYLSPTDITLKCCAVAFILHKGKHTHIYLSSWGSTNKPKGTNIPQDWLLVFRKREKFFTFALHFRLIYLKNWGLWHTPKREAIVFSMKISPPLFWRIYCKLETWERHKISIKQHLGRKRENVAKRLYVSQYEMNWTRAVVFIWVAFVLFIQIAYTIRLGQALYISLCLLFVHWKSKAWKQCNTQCAINSYQATPLWPWLSWRLNHKRCF